MIVEQVFPAVIGEMSTLRRRLVAEASVRGLEDEHTNAIVSLVPETLFHAASFLDKRTNIWRYEFGVPYGINEGLSWGTDMWVPVYCLFNALMCAHSRLSQNARTGYLERLADPDKHQAALVEIIPGYKVDSVVPVQFEVPGLGLGNHTVDW